MFEIPSYIKEKYYEILQTFNSDEYLRIVYLVIILFVVFYIIWAIYIRLSNKDLSLTESQGEITNWFDYLLYWMKYFLLLPIFTFLGFAIFSISLMVLVPKLKTYDAMLFGIILVSTVRLAAYFHPKMAEDLAKLLPLALIVSIISQPELISLRLDPNILNTIKEAAPKFLRYFILIFGLELFLKFSDLISKKS